MEKHHLDLPQDTQKALGTDGWIIGLLVGGALIFWAGQAWLAGEHLLETSVSETLVVAIFLTMLVGYAGLKMPVFAHRSPFWSTFWLVMFAGHISLLFDSFAVVLLLAYGIVFSPLAETNHRYNQFFVKTASAFAALTVGGGFYLGELWGLPWYISNGLDTPLAGLPLLAVLTPGCAVLALITAMTHPVKMDKVVMDSKQIQAAIEFTVGLLLIILTHSPILCIGILFFYTAIRRSTTKLVENTTHELKDGALNALGLIFLALVVQESGLAAYIQPWLVGSGMFFGAAVSSPFAGAIAPPVTNLHDFYVGLSMLMSGAPLFVFSSLVAIVVFTDKLEYDDLPNYMKFPAIIMGGRRKGHFEEALAYTFLVIPMVACLAVLLYVGNYSGLFVYLAEVLGIQMPVAASAVVH